MAELIILAGSNLGMREENIEKAEYQIGIEIGDIKLKSALYQTTAWGYEDEKVYLNQVFICKTPLSAENSLKKLLFIESILGRVRETSGYHARPIDLDILFYDHSIIQKPDLVVPHPRLHLRRFTLVPLAEIANNLIHPVFQKPVWQLLEECDDKLDVKRWIKSQ